MTHPVSQQIKILIIDDDQDDYFIISQYIHNISDKTFMIDWCYKFSEALEQICKGAYDLYFIDYRLGATTGLDLLREAMKNSCEEPIILLAGKGNQKIDMEAMEAGAIDYLIKSDLSTEKLERCIRYGLDRAKSMKALRQNEKKFRDIFERSKDAVFIADEDFYFKDVNKAICELLGYEIQELLQRRIYDFLASGEEGIRITKALLENNQIDDRELELLTKSGEKVSCILSATREKDEKNQSYLQGIIHDITNLKKTERATLQAAKLNATSRLLQILAHEVRNPLNNIRLSVDELLAENRDEKATVYLDIIDRNSKRIDDLISELLKSSRTTEMAMARIPLQEVISQSLAIASDRMTLKKIETRLSFPEEQRYIVGDADKLKIAFLNIIINAIEAIDHNHGLLTISIEEAGPDYLISIADNGHGISEEHLSRLFDPYFTSKRNGLGLGLAATLTILQSHRSTVDVNTKSGEGATFSISFQKA